MLLMQIFSVVELGWLPTVRADTRKHYILPSLTLGAVSAVMAHLPAPRSLTCWSEDYIRTARAKGQRSGSFLKHRFSQCDDPGGDDDGAAVWLPARRLYRRGKVFNWPGLGRLLVDSVEMRDDYPVNSGGSPAFRWRFILIQLSGGCALRRH